MVETVLWENGAVLLLDQRQLPIRKTYVTCRNSSEVAEAIYNLTVRGAPLIGVTAAMGYALGASRLETTSRHEFRQQVDQIKQELAATRPTAKNLFWALERMEAVLEAHPSASVEELKKLLVTEAHQIKKEDQDRNRKIGEHGASLFETGDRVLTHCNAGALATSGPYGTALSPIRIALEQGKKIALFADETRPVLQGARLTAWECIQDRIPVTVLTDNAAGYLMSRGMIDKVIVGADRIAANGDVANKIGTYSVAVLAQYHHIPFYVAAPLSTFDFTISTGADIPIEQRDPLEVKMLNGTYITPSEVEVSNFAFDVTPAGLISAIISEYGIARPPSVDTLKSWAQYQK
ncbi:S-methyl-5-thioribose-1-phosphate isomerase [bacterium]|nr:S-methyl-5-thioribose-1-phosphate isomerase [bacterium]